MTALEARLKKLPRWAQDYIADLVSELDQHMDPKLIPVTVHFQPETAAHKGDMVIHMSVLVPPVKGATIRFVNSDRSLLFEQIVIYVENKEEDGKVSCIVYTRRK